MRRRILLAASTLLALFDSAAAGHRRLTLSEAEQLATAALGPQTKGPLGFTLEPPLIPPKRGATFNIVWSSPVTDRVQMKAISVDIDTGDVWDPFRCERFSTPALESAQRRIRHRLGIPDAEVNSARVVAKTNGCSTLMDERPAKAAFYLYRLLGVTTNEAKTLYRYTISGGDVLYVGVSEVPINVRAGSEIKFLETRMSMYVIDDDGSIQELHVESALEHLPPPPPPKR